MSNQITRKFGATYPQVVTFKDKGTGKPLAVTGWTDIKMYIDSSKMPPDTSTQVGVLDGLIGSKQGEVEFTITTPINVGTYYYQIKYTDAAGYVGITDSDVFTIEQVIAK